MPGLLAVSGAQPGDRIDAGADLLAGRERLGRGTDRICLIRSRRCSESEASALRIDFRSLEVARSRSSSASRRLVTLDSGERHANAGPERRRRRCARLQPAASRVRPRLRAAGHRDAARRHPRVAQRLPAPLDARVRHVITENARVEATVAALKAGDLGASASCSTPRTRACATTTRSRRPRSRRRWDGCWTPGRSARGSSAEASAVTCSGLLAPGARPPDEALEVSAGTRSASGARDRRSAGYSARNRSRAIAVGLDPLRHRLDGVPGPNRRRDRRLDVVAEPGGRRRRAAPLRRRPPPRPRPAERAAQAPRRRSAATAAASAAARDAAERRLDPEPANQVEAVAQAERDPLEHGPDQGGAVVTQAEADERAAGVGVGVGRTLAGQIGEEGQALDPAVPPARRRPAARRTGSGASACWAQPQRPGGRQHHAHHVPGRPGGRGRRRERGRAGRRGSGRRRRTRLLRCRARSTARRAGRPRRRMLRRPDRRPRRRPVPCRTEFGPAGHHGALEHRGEDRRVELQRLEHRERSSAPCATSSSSVPDASRRRSRARRRAAAGRSPWAASRARRWRQTSGS